MVGQYHGPDGSAAMGIIAPFWNKIYSFGLLAGIGGSVLFAVEKGKNNRNSKNANTYFTASVIFGILTMLFNRQIMKYLGTDALVVYAIIVNISTFVQCCGYGIGQAAQPIISVNFGAKRIKRINKVLKYSIISAFTLGII